MNYCMCAILLVASMLVMSCGKRDQPIEETPQQARATIRREFMGYKLFNTTEKEIKAKCPECFHDHGLVYIDFSDKEQKENGGIVSIQFNFIHGKLYRITVGYDLLLGDFDTTVAKATEKYGTPHSTAESLSWTRNGTILSIKKTTDFRYQTLLHMPITGYTVEYIDIGLVDRDMEEQTAAAAERKKKQAAELGL